ncbi:hypothetical protein BDV06DRAFT_196762 [Aspergillus oleicola]
MQPALGREENSRWGSGYARVDSEERLNDCSRHNHGSGCSYAVISAPELITPERRFPISQDAMKPLSVCQTLPRKPFPTAMRPQIMLDRLWRQNYVFPTEIKAVTDLPR